MDDNDSLHDSLIHHNLTTLQFSNFSISNVTANNTEGSSIMTTIYGFRFIPYTVFAVACVFFNVLSVGAMLHIRGRRSVHHTLLLNLAVCDMVGSVLLWMYYNSPLIFPHFEITTLGHCMFITLVLVAPYILSLCNSFLSLLMLAINQYMAICHPLRSVTNITKGKIYLCIACAWLLSVVLATCPAFLMLMMTQQKHCTLYATEMAVHSLEICAYGLAGLIVIIVALYARVYRKILDYRKEQAQIRRTCRNNNHDSESNFKAFITTAVLTSTLVIFWLPYMVFHFISAHVEYDSISDDALRVKFYAVDFLPVLNFLTDPIVYGIRMKEIREGYQYMFHRILPCCCNDSTMQKETVGTTMRFTTLAATPT